VIDGQYRPVLLGGIISNGGDESDPKVWAGSILGDWDGRITYGGTDTMMLDMTQTNLFEVEFSVWEMNQENQPYQQVLDTSLYIDWSQPPVSVVHNPKMLVPYQPRTPEYFDVLGRKVAFYRTSGVYVAKETKLIEWKKLQ
jgi:hypothetical protein